MERFTATIDHPKMGCVMVDVYIADECEAKLAKKDEEIASLLLQAQCHAQEARTANSTIAEIYQCVSGGRGEPGNWHGAEPVRRALSCLQRARQGKGGGMRATLDPMSIKALKEFYAVDSDDELITEQNYHIEKLQNRLAQLDKTFKGCTIVREG